MVDQSICSKIKQARHNTAVRCMVISAANQTLEQVVEQSGLRRIAYNEINRAAAFEIAVYSLQQDLAYQEILMSISQARDLVCEFFELFTESNIRFFTNVVVYSTHNGDVPTYIKLTLETSFNAEDLPFAFSSMPATSATFDLGIILLGDSVSGVLWVEDED